jgi:hypothetical protein
MNSCNVGDFFAIETARREKGVGFFRRIER